MTKVVNLKKEKYDVYCGRGSKWGNPFKMNNYSQAERGRVCGEYEKWFWTTDLIYCLHELKDKVLGCFCKPLRCHCDFLASLANRLVDGFEIIVVYNASLRQTEVYFSDNDVLYVKDIDKT